MRHCYSKHHEGHPRLVPAAGAAHKRTLFGHGGRCAPCTPPPFPMGTAATKSMGRGFTRLGRRASTHKALGESAPRPWEGTGGRHLIPGA